MADDRLRDIPILLVDIVEFTTRYESTEDRRAVMRYLQKILTDAARLFMPYGNVWEVLRRHGTGDGYCASLVSIPPQVACKYALDICDRLAQYNASRGVLPLHLRMVLVYGDVESQDDQILSNAFVVAERIISFEPFKQHLKRHPTAFPLAASRLFFRALQDVQTIVGPGD